MSQSLTQLPPLTVISHLSMPAGKAAERAAEIKVVKYSAISTTHDILSISFKNFSPLNSATATVLTVPGKRLSSATRDNGE